MPMDTCKSANELNMNAVYYFYILYSNYLYCDSQTDVSFSTKFETVRFAFPNLFEESMIYHSHQRDKYVTDFIIKLYMYIHF